jgi:ParB-like chromosome segregation protein Spo0J
LFIPCNEETMTATTNHLAHKSVAPKRKDVFLVNPFRVTLVTDPNHALYQRRVRRPFVEEIVLGMLAHGVKEAVVIRPNGEDSKGPIWEVVDGRQRVINAREAWYRQERQGVPEDKRITVPVKTEELSDKAAMELAMMLNAHTQEETPLEKAEFIKKYLDVVGDTPESRATVGREYRMSGEMINYHLKVLAGSDALHQAVESGMSISAAAAIAAKVPRDKQKAVIEKEVRTVKDAKRAAKAIVAGKEITKGPRAMSEGDVRRFRDYLKRQFPPNQAAVECLDVVLGESTSGELHEAAKKARQKTTTVRIGRTVAPVPRETSPAKPSPKPAKKTKNGRRSR